MATTGTITHGWTTGQADAGKDVDADNLNDHSISSISIDAADIVSGTIDDARIPSSIARDSEITPAMAAAKVYSYSSFR